VRSARHGRINAAVHGNGPTFGHFVACLWQGGAYFHFVPRLSQSATEPCPTHALDNSSCSEELEFGCSEYEDAADNILESVSYSLQCVLCKSPATLSAVLLPCKHVNLCMPCTSILMLSSPDMPTCPTCGDRVKDFIPDIEIALHRHD
jgi:hypothetical protein